MVNWNNLPFEMKQQILLALGDNDNACLYKCLFVNKEWLSMCQPLLYKNVSLRVEYGDKLLDTIRHSACQSGQWVKSVFMKSFEEPLQLDVSQEALYILMRCCPNVEDVDAQGEWDDGQWAYLGNALIELNIWELRTLPKQYDPYCFGEYLFATLCVADTHTLQSQQQGF